MVTTRRAAAAERARAAAMAFSKLSGDEQGIILGQLRNALEPRLVMYFSSASKELRALLPPAARQQLRADYEEATALCLKVGMRDCKELREATEVDWGDKGLLCSRPGDAGQAGLGAASAQGLTLDEYSGSAGPDGVQRLAEGLVAGALPAVTRLAIDGMHVGDAGASALAAALDRGALPRLRGLHLDERRHRRRGAGGPRAGLAAAARAGGLFLGGNPLGDEGLAALVAPPPPAGTPPPPAGGLKKLEGSTSRHPDHRRRVRHPCRRARQRRAACAREARFWRIPASDAAMAAVYEARANLRNVTRRRGRGRGG